MGLFLKDMYTTLVIDGNTEKEHPFFSRLEPLICTYKVDFFFNEILGTSWNMN